MNWFQKKKHKELDSWYELSSNDVGPETQNILMEWLSVLPSSSHGILDMAAGQGYEARFMSKLGHRVTAYDGSRNMIRGSVYPVNQADMTNIKLPRASHEGILVKDVWVFLTDEERCRSLDIFYNALVRGGSVLIMSQYSDTRAHILSNESSFPFKVIRSDFPSDDDWMRYVESSTNNGGEILSIEYKTDSESFDYESARAGFSLDLTAFPFNSAYSAENRWISGRNQWVAQLTK